MKKGYSMKSGVCFSNCMLKTALSTFLCLFFFITPTLSSALEPIVLEEGWESFTPALSMEFLEDESNSLTIEEILAGKKNEDFFQSKSKFPVFGASQSIYWGRFIVKNPLDKPQEWFLEAWHLIQYADLYIVENGKVTYKRTEGRIFPYSHREVDFHNTTFNGDIPPQSEYTVYIKMKSAAPIFSFTLWSHEAFYEMMQAEIAINGFLLGIMVVMLFYNLFIFFSLKDSRYLHYVFFIFSGLLATLTLNQIGFQLFWSDSPEWELKSTFLFLPLPGIFGILFSQGFLQTKENNPIIHRLLSILGGYFFLVTIVMQFNAVWGLKLLLLSPIPFAVLVLLAGIKRYRAGFRPAGYFLIAWTIFFSAIFTRGFGVLDVIPISQFFFVYGRQIAYAFDAVILSMALTSLINDLKGEKEKANFERIEAQRVHSEELEHKVEERTEELHNALEELHLRQEQLVLVEKQACLGQLVAGVAHEINTPVSIGITAASHFQDLNKEIKKNMEGNTLKKTLLESFLNDSWKISEMILKSLNRTGDLVRSFKMVAADQRNEDKRRFFIKE